MSFDLKELIKAANRSLSEKAGRNLNDIEILILEGAWNREEYDQIAAKHQYATSYISQDVAPKLWKELSEALGERVRKSNFKEALKRYWQGQALDRDRLAAAKPAPIGDRQIQHDDIQNDYTEDCYIERPPIESLCYETLLQPGALVRIKAPTLMGKTCLLNRLLAQLAVQNYRTVSLSFELADRQIHFTDLDKFLRWFCLNLSRELGLPHQLEQYWDEAGMGSKVSCTTYLEEYVLRQSDRPLVICLDKVDILFPYPEIYEDVFGLLRSWYEKARSRPIWKQLRLVIVHSTDVYIRLNLHQSPFNVGTPIELPEFTQDQVRSFAQQHGLAADQALILPLIDLVGGHPYLLEQAFEAIKTHPERSLAQFLAAAPTDAGIYAHHLRDHWLTLSSQPQLTAALKAVMLSDRPVQLEPTQAYQLQSLGLVKLVGNQAAPRCALYRLYFQTHWRASDGSNPT
ncbi:MAG: AAA-like domain-containing protein [Oscillatoriophycideae cyanobacterium NC_groundwater_1537_Pr4_S-0.65um_50_18]|nr:AAA-like domain-containing protein [Oscillatoriophycideae cyanobacterium NC_groundwater_1537_Pr4_S-0.65um_50_18]